ncbi:MAG TPA: hypothetical protein VFE96_09935 [Candidatus Bathyarchaeia archaeon]|jgi:uncharacterized coiled-coil DUF342 family protein|nr:hypothetical protein [Candidatus Bathyarchaeia archaeon]
MTNLDTLADERQRIKTDERKILGALSEVGNKLDKTRSQLLESRKTRDELNETVRALKKTRDGLRDKARESITKLKSLQLTSPKILQAVTDEHELQQLEWQVQTAPLGKEEEKRLMAKIRTLETRVTASKRILKLREEIASAHKEADELHAKIQELAEESQKHHEEIVILSERFDALKAKQDEVRKSLNQLRGEYRETDEKYKTIKKSIDLAEKMDQRQKEEAHKQNLKEAAKKKLSQGEKLSLHELGALYGEEE